MRGKSARGGGAVVKSPHARLSPNSGPMNKYITQGRDGERQTIEKQQSTKGRQTEVKEQKEKMG